MRFVNKALLLLIILILFSSNAPLGRIDYRKGIKNNVCKTLIGNTLVYVVFVDTKETAPWTEFDIQSTLDSVDVAIAWIQEQARLKNIDVKIRSDYFIGNEFTPIRKNMEYGTIKESATTPNTKKGIESLNKWADGIAARIGKEVEISTKDGIPEIKNPRNKERLIAHLRDEYQLESVCLLYMLNNYYKNDISLCINPLNTDDIEFSIVSYKYPSVIAQNVLKLFGAVSLSKSIYRNNEKKIKLAKEFFPMDIMQDIYGIKLDQINIGEFTEHMIGWQEHLDPKYQPLLTDNFSRIR